MSKSFLIGSIDGERHRLVTTKFHFLALFASCCGLFVTAACASMHEKEPPIVSPDTPLSLAEERSNTNVTLLNPQVGQSIGICLHGEKARIVMLREVDKNCHSLFWINLDTLVNTEASILQNSVNDTLAAGGQVQALCKSCTATCQTVRWISGQSSYSDLNVGGGQTPSQCIDQAQAACEAGYSRYLFSATCSQ